MQYTDEMVESKNERNGHKKYIFTFLRVRLPVVAFSMSLVGGHSKQKETVAVQFESNR